MPLASTRPSAINADFTSTVCVAAAVFSATFSVLLPASHRARCSRTRWSAQPRQSAHKKTSRVSAHGCFSCEVPTQLVVMHVWCHSKAQCQGSSSANWTEHVRRLHRMAELYRRSGSLRWEVDAHGLAEGAAAVRPRDDAAARRAAVEREWCRRSRQPARRGQADQELPELPREVIVTRDEGTKGRGPLEGLRAGLKALPVPASRPPTSRAATCPCSSPASCEADDRSWFARLRRCGDGDRRLHAPAVSRLSPQRRCPISKGCSRNDRLRPLFLFEAVNTRRVDACGDDRRSRVLQHTAESQHAGRLPARSR